MDSSPTKSADKIGSNEHMSIQLVRPHKAREIQNLSIVWLDNSIDEVNNNGLHRIISKLQQLVRTVYTFTDVDKCVNFLTNAKKEDIILLLSDNCVETTVPIIYEMSQVSLIYIFPGDNAKHEEWSQQWTKVNGIFTSITSLYRELICATEECNQNVISISFISSNDGTKSRSLDELDSSFMYTQLLKEILLAIDFEQHHIKEFLTYCREVLVDNIHELRNVDKLEAEYHCHQPIWWYTYQSFLYPMVNRTLRFMDVDVIIKLGFYIRDLHRNITQRHSNSTPVAILLSLSSFTVVKLYLAQILISYGTHKRYRSAQLHALADHIRKESFSDQKVWYRMGSLMIKLGQFNKAQEVFETMLKCTYDVREKANIYHMLEFVKYNNGEYVEAITFYEKSIEIMLNIFSPTHLQDLAVSYKNIAAVYDKIGEYSRALSYHEKALGICQNDNPSADNSNLMDGCSKAVLSLEISVNILQQTLLADDPYLARFYDRYGSVYKEMGDDSKVLSFYERALKIKEKNLPSNYPDLATSYASRGAIFENMGESLTAQSFYQRALNIGQISFIAKFLKTF